MLAWDSLKEIEEFAAEHAAEDLHREKKRMPGVNPVGAGWIETAGRNVTKKKRSAATRATTPSVITLNPAIRDRVKSGHREWQKT